MPAADDGFVPLARVLCAPVADDEPVALAPVASEPEAAPELTELARDVRVLSARVADAEALLADVLARLP